MAAVPPPAIATWWLDLGFDYGPYAGCCGEYALSTVIQAVHPDDHETVVDAVKQIQAAEHGTPMGTLPANLMPVLASHGVLSTDVSDKALLSYYTPAFAANHLAIVGLWVTSFIPWLPPCSPNSFGAMPHWVVAYDRTAAGVLCRGINFLATYSEAEITAADMQLGITIEVPQ